MHVPFFRFEFDPGALAGIEECLRSGWLTTGPKTKEFEKQFADYLQYDGELHAVALNSCTAALHLALEAIGIGRGDVVVVPTLTFAATAEVVRYFDATPVFVDTDPDTFNLDLDHLEEVLTTLRDGKPIPQLGTDYGEVKAIIPVHYAGQPCDMVRIHRFAERFGVQVIEDAAHAFPAGWKNGDSVKYVGAGSSRVACFSFYANKTITTSEGGMAVTTDEELADRMRLMALHGMNRDAWKRFTASGSWDYQLVAPGYKYNMTDIASSIGLSQLTRAEEFRTSRKAISEAYNAAFEPCDQIDTLTWGDGLLHSHHLYIIKLKLESLRVNRAEFVDILKEHGIMCSVHWRPLHMHPYYKETYGYQAEDYPVAGCEWERIVSLPLFPSMQLAETQYVIDTVLRVAKENAK
ncbi:MAG: UDP-4-amino-4,6-dideoxy-N-acetyl-beta-L-altrosamine transaminase [Ectothiorhodospiraceae bacterium]|nr:UDP-4-amino-4,6-dideoxy-N-acetyl-beta-L-altrosamine transaminase [Ectothiorhodospiraceae bacterium]